MCLLILAHRVSPHYPLIVAANRDEFHARPTAVSEFWEEQPNLLAGRDLEQGGTWMGVTRQGRFAAITNYRDPARTAPAPRSRGELPISFLTGPQDAQSCLAELANRASEYAGFNLLLGEGDELWYFTNSLPQEDRVPVRLEPGVYGLSNARLDTPWPKVSLGKQRLQQLLEREGEAEHAALLEVVADSALADSATLQQQGLDHEMDQLLSAQFIVTPTYGTRSSTTMCRDNKGHTSWRELSFNELGEIKAQREASFEQLR